MTQRKGITESGPRLKAMNDALERDRLRLTDAEWKLYGKRIFFDTDRERIDRLDKMERHIKGTGEQGFHMQGNDLVQRLRDRAYSGLPDPLSEQAADEIARLRLAICRLAEQDATLSVQGGHILVTMDGTLADAERAAVDRARIALRDMDHNAMTMQQIEDYESLCGLLLRLA